VLDPLSSLNSLDSISPVASTVSKAVSSATSSAVNSATSGVSSWFAENGGRIIAIVLGLLLVAAGIFQFGKVQETLGAAARTAAAV
jgi:hypothetical protein